jgi:hypothetical protein
VGGLECDDGKVNMDADVCGGIGGGECEWACGQKTEERTSVEDAGIETWQQRACTNDV